MTFARCAQSHFENVSGVYWKWMIGLLCFKAGVALAPCIETSFNSFRVTFERCLAPTKVAVFVGNLDEEPARRDSEVFDPCDFSHDDRDVVGSRPSCFCYQLRCQARC